MRNRHALEREGGGGHLGFLEPASPITEFSDMGWGDGSISKALVLQEDLILVPRTQVKSVKRAEEMAPWIKHWLSKPETQVHIP